MEERYSAHDHACTIHTANRSHIEFAIAYMFRIIMEEIDCVPKIDEYVMENYGVSNAAATAFFVYSLNMLEHGFTSISTELWNSIKQHKDELDSMANQLGVKLNWNKTLHYFD